MLTYPMQMYIGTTQSQKIPFFTINFILHDHIINDVIRPIQLKLDDLIKSVQNIKREIYVSNSTQ